MAVTFWYADVVGGFCDNAFSFTASNLSTAFVFPGNRQSKKSKIKNRPHPFTTASSKLNTVLAIKVSAAHSAASKEASCGKRPNFRNFLASSGLFW